MKALDWMLARAVDGAAAVWIAWAVLKLTGRA